MSSSRRRHGALVDANHFRLSGDGLEIVLGPGVPGPVRFGYRAAPPAWCFPGDEVTSHHGAWGRSVSVTLACGPEDGDTATLTVLVPRVHVGKEGLVRVHTVAVTTTRSRHRDDCRTPGQIDRSRVVELDGAASFAPPDQNQLSERG